MFERMLKELGQLNGQSISVPMESDAEGYFDKECPEPNCMFSFKIYAEDWRNIVRNEEVFCPSCRHAAPAKSWFTTDQVEQIRNYGINHIRGVINEAAREDARAWNSQQPRNSFLKITLEVKGSPRPALLPIAAAEPMRLRTQCESCGCRYSYVGAAFFCPSCGKNSAEHTFSQTLTSIRTAAGAGKVLREALDKDNAEVLTRTLLEKGFQDLVMSFQRLCEQLLGEHWPTVSVRRNVFQSLDDGSAVWETAFGAPYADLIEADELRRLRIYFQRRHLLAHQQGIIDDDYIKRSGDQHYARGQRLLLREADVLDFVDLVEKLGSGLILRTQRMP